MTAPADPTRAHPDDPTPLLTAAQITAAIGCTEAAAARYATPLSITCERYHLDTPARLAAFLAQIGHESARLARVTENLNYSATGLALTWPNRYRGGDGQPNATAQRLHRNPEAIANHVYADRLGNGPEHTGDGWRYRGRGLIQITGRENYAAVSRGLGINAITHPEILESPLYAALSAGWYWHTRNLNALADAADHVAITRRINGGTHGLDDRLALARRALQALA